MENAVFMRGMHGASDLRNQLRRLPYRDRRAPNYFVKLTAFNELHTEVTATFALADLVDGDDARMVETGGGLCLATKTLQMRFGGPRARGDHFERNSTVQGFLMGAINYTLTAPPNFLQQLVVPKVSKHLCWSDGFLSICCSRTIIAAGVIRLRRGYGGQADPGYSFIREQTETGLEQASRAGSLPCVSRNFCPALSANARHELHKLTPVPDTNFTNSHE
jgi:hypothetical protein